MMLWKVQDIVAVQLSTNRLVINCFILCKQIVIRSMQHK